MRSKCINEVILVSVLKYKILEALADGTQQKSSSFRNEFWKGDVIAPPTWLTMQESLSSWVNSRPPRSFSMCLKCISLKAFSLEQLPHIIVVTFIPKLNILMFYYIGVDEI
jgi:hypothetical protein